jgi:serine/threonine protein kinase
VELIPGACIGNYRIEYELASSGSGLLFEAQHVVVPRRAIVKIIRPGHATDPSRIVETLREARTLESIAHPGVPIVYEAGCLPHYGPWYAFEANSGPTLDALLASGPLPVVAVAALLRDIADILENAHHRGVIHRGLRPSRIVITAAGRNPLCIPDWGDAIVYDATSHAPQALTEAARSYIAPELLRHASGDIPHLDGRVDVFSLGVIAHRALTGRLPFAPGLGAEPYAPSHERRPEAPRGLTALIDSMLAYQRMDRPTASEVRTSVDQLFARASAYPVPIAFAGEAPLLPPASPEDLVALEERRYVRRPRWTPEVRYAEAIDIIDDTITEKDGPDEFMD